jgi:hypothetical protein
MTKRSRNLRRNPGGLHALDPIGAFSAKVQSATALPLGSHSNAYSFDLDTALCPGKLKPWKNAGEILVSSWKSRMQPTAAKTTEFASPVVCTSSAKSANAKFKWRESKILIRACGAEKGVPGEALARD